MTALGFTVYVAGKPRDSGSSVYNDKDELIALESGHCLRISSFLHYRTLQVELYKTQLEFNDL